MKKIVLAIVLLFCLCGCTKADINSTTRKLDQIFDEFPSFGTYRYNNSMDYYSYYLPSDLSEEPLDSDSIVIKYNDSRIIMNLNINGIINNRYYKKHFLEDEGFFDDNYLVYENSGKYTGSDKVSKKYIYKLYNYKDTYVLNLITNDMNYYGTVSLTDISNISRQLLVMAKNTAVTYDNVLADFSKKDVIDYQKKQINLFDSTLPVNGELGSMLVEGAIIGDGSVVTPSENEEPIDISTDENKESELPLE